MSVFRRSKKEGAIYDLGLLNAIRALPIPARQVITLALEDLQQRHQDRYGNPDVIVGLGDSISIVLTNSVTVNANAFEAGYNNSVATNNIFIIYPDSLAGSVSNVLYIPSASATNWGTYWMTASDASGSVTSLPAVLTWSGFGVSSLGVLRVRATDTFYDSNNGTLFAVVPLPAGATVAWPETADGAAGPVTVAADRSVIVTGPASIVGAVPAP